MIKDVVHLFINRWDFFLKLIFEHIVISFSAIFLAIVLGGLLGVLACEYKKCSKFIMGVINFLYTIPAISLLGLLIPITGVGNNTAIVTLTIYGLLPMIRNTYVGITNVDTSIVEASVAMGSTKLQVLCKIKIPLAMTVILAGVKNMVVMTIALTGIASFVGAGGLGVAIYRGITTNSKSMIIIGSLLIALLAIISDFIIEKLENKIGSYLS